MKKQRKNKRAVNKDIAATTTSKDWGFGPVSGKGGKTTNCAISDTMIYREQKEMNKR